jgi:hypothetical protein
MNWNTERGRSTDRVEEKINAEHDNPSRGAIRGQYAHDGLRERAKFGKFY